MTLTNVLAGIAVEDLGQSLIWYEYLFGRPADARTMVDKGEDEVDVEHLRCHPN